MKHTIQMQAQTTYLASLEPNLINERAKREKVITKSTWKVSKVAREARWDGQVGVMIEKIEPETGQSVFRPRLKSN